MFYNFAVLGLAASSVDGLAAQCFVSLRRRLVPVAVRQGAGRRRAPGRPRLSGWEAEAKRVQTARHRTSRIYTYICFAQTHSGFCVFAFIWCWSFIIFLSLVVLHCSMIEILSFQGSHFEYFWFSAKQDLLIQDFSRLLTLVDTWFFKVLLVHRTLIQCHFQGFGKTAVPDRCHFMKNFCFQRFSS